MNGAVAILAGLVANAFAEYTWGFVAPFDIAGLVLIGVPFLACCLWKHDNYADTRFADTDGTALGQNDCKTTFGIMKGACVAFRDINQVGQCIAHLPKFSPR